MTIHFLRSVTLLSLLLALGGCASDAVEPALEIAVVESALDRLTIDATGEEGQVRIELRRGAPRVEGFTADTKVYGNYEGDSLVTDSQGHAFFAEVGGHAPVDPSWMHRLAKVQGDFDIQQRKRDLALTHEVALLIADDESYDFELRRLARDLSVNAEMSLEEWNRDGAPRVDDPATNDPETAQIEGEGGIVDKAAALYVHQVFARRSSCCVGFGEHSAARLRVFNSTGGMVTQINSANHGDVYFAPGMTDVANCPRTVSGRSNQLPPFQPYAAMDLTHNGNQQAGGCHSSYDATPPTAGGHVCNDDTLAQITNVSRNAFSHWTTCTDAVIRSVAPTCSDRAN